MEKVKVAVFLPSLLLNCTDGRSEVEIEASTLRECVDGLIARYPLLAVHLYDEERQLRGHVNLFHNDTNVKWLDDWGVAVRPGDTLTILQAVSGGADPQRLAAGACRPPRVARRPARKEGLGQGAKAAGFGALGRAEPVAAATGSGMEGLGRKAAP